MRTFLWKKSTWRKTMTESREMRPTRLRPAIDVQGSRNEEIKTIDYTTNSFENKVRGHLTLPKDWPTGKYRVEVYINDGLDKTIDYTIE
jgi:hypothetical protein